MSSARSLCSLSHWKYTSPTPHRCLLSRRCRAPANRLLTGIPEPTAKHGSMQSGDDDRYAGSNISNISIGLFVFHFLFVWSTVVDMSVISHIVEDAASLYVPAAHVVPVGGDGVSSTNDHRSPMQAALDSFGLKISIPHVQLLKWREQVSSSRGKTSFFNLLMTQVSLPFFDVKGEAKNTKEKRLRTVAGRISKATKKSRCNSKAFTDGKTHSQKKKMKKRRQTRKFNSTMYFPSTPPPALFTPPLSSFQARYMT